MKSFWKRSCLITAILLLFTSTNISAAPVSNTNLMYISPLSGSTSIFLNSSWVGLKSFDTRLYIGNLGYTTIETCIFPSKGAYYSKLLVELQQYKKGKWTTIYTFKQNKKGVNGCYLNRFINKGYKYRLKNKVSVYKSKGSKLLNSKTFYSSTKKY